MKKRNYIIVVFLLLFISSGCLNGFYIQARKMKSIEDPNNLGCKLDIYTHPGSALDNCTIAFENCNNRSLGAFSTYNFYKYLKEYSWFENETLELVLKSDEGEIDTFMFQILTDSVVYLYSNVNMPD